MQMLDQCRQQSVTTRDRDDDLIRVEVAHENRLHREAVCRMSFAGPSRHRTARCSMNCSKWLRDYDANAEKRGPSY